MRNPKSEIRNKSEIPNLNIQNGFEFRDSSFEFVARSGIVHRLDKETSGIILVAKTLEAFINLQAQFKERKVQKTYLALAHGKIEPAEGEINVSVGRLPWNRKRFGVVAEGRESVTHYRVISNYQLPATNESLTLVELSPKTGRTHQIRVHLQYIKHPIFADPLYAGRKTSRNDRKLLSRVFLHASKISFSHPETGKVLAFESSIPQGLTSFLENLNS
ncbi:MAG: RluA family pseudouridine synthase [Candidatus Levybacteria bacterium]|nr:RluA family pseudouridine synthase [Candidatus Levybacteria bacterium]